MTDSWIKSSHSAQGNCVEVAFLGGQVAIRDSKDQHGLMLMFNRTEWQAFLDGVRDGEFNLPQRT